MNFERFFGSTGGILQSNFLDVSPPSLEGDAMSSLQGFFKSSECESLRFTQEQLEKLFDAADSDKARRLVAPSAFPCRWSKTVDVHGKWWDESHAIFGSYHKLTSHLKKWINPSLQDPFSMGQLLKRIIRRHWKSHKQNLNYCNFPNAPPICYLSISQKSLLSLSFRMAPLVWHGMFPQNDESQDGAIQFEELCSWLCDTPCFSKCPLHGVENVFPRWIWWGKNTKTPKMVVWSSVLPTFDEFVEARLIELHNCAYLSWTGWRWKWFFATRIILFQVEWLSQGFQGTSDVESGRNGLH